MLECAELPATVEKQIIEIQIQEKAQQIYSHVVRRKVADMVKDEAMKKKIDEALVKLQSEMDALETLHKETESK